MKQFNFFLAAFLLILSNSFLTIAQDYQPSHSNKSVSEVELSGQKEKILETDNYAIGSKLSYIINQGQWDGEVLFMANGAGFRLWVTQKSLVYEFMASSASDSTMLGHVVKMNFDLAQAGYISAGKESSGVVNFFNGSDRSKWIEKVFPCDCMGKMVCLDMTSSWSLEQIYHRLNSRWTERKMFC